LFYARPRRSYALDDPLRGILNVLAVQTLRQIRQAVGERFRLGQRRLRLQFRDDSWLQLPDYFGL
jgi:hypothetical protein